MNKKITTFAGLLALAMASLFIMGWRYFDREPVLTSTLPTVPNVERSLPGNGEVIRPLPDEIENESPDDLMSGSFQQKVPFIVQAPLGNWSNPVFQNACEESSVIMAMGWVKGVQKISATEAIGQIQDIVEFENETFGYNADTDLSDVEKIFVQHFKHENVQVKRNVKSEDMVDELRKGNLIVVPVFGQALKNPNFTSPGPIAHMLVITGYDNENKKFITNDPGTKRGASYAYSEEIMMDAIWEYPSGHGPLDPPIEGKSKKAMLVISKP